MILYIQTLISLICSVHVILMKKCMFLHIMHFSSASVSSSLSSSGRFTFFLFALLLKPHQSLALFLGWLDWIFWSSLYVYVMIILDALSAGLHFQTKVRKVYFHLWTWWWNCIYSPLTILCVHHLKSLQSPYRVKPIESSRIN